MAQFDTKVPPYKPTRDIPFDWNTFKRGLNILLQENEIDKEELAQADNVLLIGKGVPTKRWGSSTYFQSGNATGSVRGLQGYYPSGASGIPELLALTDDGFLTKRNGASYTRINGVSWASGLNAYMAQLDNKVYIVNGQRELARYSTPTLVGFPTIGLPVVTGATNLSNATGSTVKGYRVSSISNVGETLASTSFELRSQPVNLGGTAGGTIRLFITPASTASGVLSGMNIYGRETGNERFIGFLPGNATVFNDDGSATPTEFTFPPTSDSTGGPKAQFIKRFQDRLVYAGLDGDPSKVLISGRWPNHEKFDLANGGNYIKVEPDAGDNVVQIEAFSDRIIVFKERSIWQVTLGSEQIGNFFVTTPILKLITASNGAIGPRSITPVENDVYYLSRRGVFSIGYQTGFTVDTLRSNEISVRIRPYFKNLTTAQLKTAVATYSDGKYILAFPSKSQTMVFDRERLAWTGPWNLDSTVYETFYDTAQDPHLLFAKNNQVNVDEFSQSFIDDNGEAISTIVRTRAEDFGDWSIFKNIRNVFTQMRNVTGSVSVDIQIEQKSGLVTSAKSFNITPSSGNSGWGADMWGSSMWGSSNSRAGSIESVVTIRWANLNKLGRTMQLTFRTTAAAANYELLGVRGDAKPVGRGFNPSSWRI